MKSILYALLIGMLTMAAAGCSGSSGSPQPTIVSGVASAGLIKNGTVSIFALNADGSKGSLLKTATTDSAGAYSADISPYSGPVIIEAVGNYTDEATGATMTITAEKPLRAACPSASGAVSVAVTPITDLAVSRAGTLTVAAIAAANKEVSDTFKFDIINTRPVEPVAAVLYDGATTQAQRDYTLALATVSQMGNGAPAATIVSALNADMSAGNGLSATMSATFTNALTTFLTTNPNNKTGAGTDSTNLTSVGARTAVLRFASSGAAASSLSGIQLAVGLPAGVTVVSDHVGGEVLPGALAASGVVPAGSYIIGRYSSQPAAVTIALLSTTSFGTGEFAAMTVNLPPGSAYTVADFPVSGVKLVGAGGNTVPGVDVGATLTLQ